MVYRWLDVALARLRGVEPHEVLQVIYAKRRLPIPSTVGDTPVVVICARTHAGRALAVAVRKIGPLDHEIVAVRALAADELAQFEQWEAKQDG